MIDGQVDCQIDYQIDCQDDCQNQHPFNRALVAYTSIYNRKSI